MGRRRLWIIVGTALAAAVLLVLALALLVPRAPFRFLDGQDAIPISDRWKGALVYSWKANYDRIIGGARAELVSLGWESASYNRFVRDSDQPNYVDTIWIIPDARISLAGPEGDLEYLSNYLNRDFSVDPRQRVRTPGWVTVIVSIRQPPGLWDRIKAVFGL